MSFLRSEEKVMKEVHLHWTFFLRSGLCAAFGFFIMLFGSIGTVMSDDPKASSAFSFVFWGLVLCSPLAYKVLFNMTKKYVITNQRVYVEEGIIAKTKTDVPYNKVNDIQMSQSIVQRIFGSGDIHVHTGNSKPIVIKHVTSPDDFKNELFDVIAAKNKAA